MPYGFFFLCYDKFGSSIVAVGKFDNTAPLGSSAGPVVTYEFSHKDIALREVVGCSVLATSELFKLLIIILLSAAEY